MSNVKTNTEKPKRDKYTWLANKCVPSSGNNRYGNALDICRALGTLNMDY